MQNTQDHSFKIYPCFFNFFFFDFYHHQRTDRGEVVFVYFTFKLNEGNLLLNWQIKNATFVSFTLQIVTSCPHIFYYRVMSKMNAV